MLAGNYNSDLVNVLLGKGEEVKAQSVKISPQFIYWEMSKLPLDNLFLYAIIKVMKPSKRKKRRLKKKNMSDNTKIWEGETHGIDNSKLYIDPQETSEIKMVADEKVFPAIKAQDKIRNLTFQRNIAILLALLFLILAL